MDQSASSQDHDEDSTRMRIMRAARECFERHGVAKTNMEDVARAARLSRQSLYRYYANRDELMNAALLKVLRDFNQRARAAVEDAAGFEETVVKALTLAVEMGVGDHSIRLALSPDAMGASLELVESAEFLDVAAELWVPLLRHGIESGEAREGLDVRSTARWLVDIEFLFTTKILEGSAELAEIPGLVDEFVVPGLLPRVATPSPAPR